MAASVIKFENVYKEYKLGRIGTGTFIKDVQSFWARIRGKDDPNSLIQASGAVGLNVRDSILALQDISLDIKKGDTLGIIGKNGSGKSTLLKLISKVTAPSKGTIRLRGSVGSLLEVGAGFHPELTGMENIFMNGAVLGIKRNEIKNRLDEIIDFAGIGNFIDTPVKRYSSGMYVRLAFSVSIHLNPDIFIVDEVLSVGDSDFQRKCLDKLADFRRSGNTSLFVSHNMLTVENLCNSVLILEEGRLLLHSYDVKDAISQYIYRNREREQFPSFWSIPASPLNNECTAEEFSLIDDTGNIITNPYDHTSSINVRIKLKNIQSDLKDIGYALYSGEGEHLYSSIIDAEDIKELFSGNVNELSLISQLPIEILPDGIYRLSLISNEKVSIYLVLHRTKLDFAGKQAHKPGLISPIIKWSAL
jgi:lipopolysaccharide transport system ATP-binding protein